MGIQKTGLIQFLNGQNMSDPQMVQSFDALYSKCLKSAIIVQIWNAIWRKNRLKKHPKSDQFSSEFKWATSHVTIQNLNCLVFRLIQISGIQYLDEQCIGVYLSVAYGAKW